MLWITWTVTAYKSGLYLARLRHFQKRSKNLNILKNIRTKNILLFFLLLLFLLFFFSFVLSFFLFLFFFLLDSAPSISLIDAGKRNFDETSLRRDDDMNRSVPETRIKHRVSRSADSIKILIKRKYRLSRNWSRWIMQSRLTVAVLA